MPKKTTIKSIPLEIKVPQERIARVYVRGGFSDSVNLSAQYTEFGARTRIMISNKLYQTLEMFFELRKHKLTDMQYKYAPDKEDYNDFCIYVITNVFGKKVNVEDNYAYNWRSIFEKLHFVIERAPYNEVLDIVWAICNWLSENYLHHNNCMYETMNYVFEREQLGFRFVNGKIVPLSD